MPKIYGSHGKRHRPFRSTRRKDKMVSLPSSKTLAKGNTFQAVDSYGIKPNPFPRALLTQCKYTHINIPLTTSVQDLSVGNTYRLNSIWDPFFPVGGTTVAGHTQLASLYGKYWVMGAKVTVSFNNPQTDGMTCGCRLRIEAGTTAIGQTSALIGSQPNTYLQGIQDSGNQRRQFNFYVKPWTLMGLSKLEYLSNSERYSSVISGNPVGAANSCLMDVFCIDSTQTSNIIRYSVNITYYVKLYSRLPLLQSST